jgi:hypothetical protein
MSNQYLKIIIAVFITLSIITSFPWLDKKINGQKESESVNVSGIDFSVFTENSVDKITIKKGADEKILSAKDNAWYIGEDQADAEKIDQFFTSLSKIKIGEIVAQKEASYANFEVDKENGYCLTFSQEGNNATFFVGKAGSTGQDFYLRKDASRNVYLANGDLRTKLTWEESRWKKEDNNEETEIKKEDENPLERK